MPIDKDGNPITDSSGLGSTASADPWQESHPFENNPLYNPADRPPVDAELIDTDSKVLESMTDESLLLEPRKSGSGSGSLSSSKSGSGFSNSDYWASQNSVAHPASNQGTVSRAKKYQMVQQRSGKAQMSETDERLRQGGFAIVIFGIGATLLPLFGFQWRRIRADGELTSILGLVVGLVGVGLVAYAMRRCKSDAAITAGCLAILVTGVSCGGYLYQSYKSADEEVVEEQRAPVIKRGPIRESADSITVNNRSKRSGDRDSNVVSEQSKDRDKHLAELKNQIDSKTNERISSSSKRNDLRIRTSFLNCGVVHDHDANSTELGKEYEFGELAGQSTKTGKALISSRPIVGLDTMSDSTGSSHFELVVPIIDKPKFEDSLAGAAGFYLAGINLNVQAQQIIGMQVLLAPLKGTQLDIEKIEEGAWIGRSTDDPQSSISDGRLVYGIVAYKSRNQIAGLSMVYRQ